MAYRGLFILVEGNDDKRFFEKIIKPKLEKKYNWVKIWCYANVKKEKIDKFIKSIKAMGEDYIYVADINDSPCVTAKKQKIRNKLGDIDEDRITIVIREIESWYLAGLNDIASKKLEIPNLSTTNEITKEKFNSLIPKKYDSRIDFMLEILKFFSIEIAKHKNGSFRYFVDKYIWETSSENVGNDR